MSRKNWLENVGPQLIRNGYKIVVVGDDKRAVDSGWPDICVTEDDCAKRRGCFSVGVQTGTGAAPVYAFDVDSEDEGVSREFEEACGDIACAVRVGQRPKLAIFFRMLEPAQRGIPESKNLFKKAAAQVAIGFRGNRQYMVAYGVHHTEEDASGNRRDVLYSWPYEDLGFELLSIKAEQLPLLTVEQRDGLIQKFGEIAQAHGYSAAKPSDPAELGDLGIDNDIEALSGAGLPFAKAKQVLYGSGLDPAVYDDWITAGMALAASYRSSEEAFRLWDEWSSQAANYSGVLELSRKWESFSADRDAPVTMGTLVYRYLVYRGDFSRVYLTRGMVERIWQQFKGSVLKSTDGKHWWLYNGVHWQEGTNEQVDAKIRKPMEVEYRQTIMTAPDDEAKKAAKKWYEKYMKDPAREVVAVREGYKKLEFNLIGDSVFDAGTRYVGVKNGDIDLTNGTFLAPESKRKISRELAVPYDADAQCPLWRKTLQECLSDERKGLDGKEEAECFKRLVGYALSGEKGEDVMVFLWGGGSNGKTTVTRTILEVMGDYGAQMRAETLATKLESRTNLGGARPDLTALRGKLFAVCEELPDEAKLNSTIAKTLASKTKLTTRDLYKSEISFDMTATVFVCTNYLPALTDVSYGIIRRLRLFNFPNSYKSDPTLADRLRKEYPGILNWMLEGLRDYRKYGLGETGSMLDAKRNWVRSEDAVGLWLEERVAYERGCEIRVAEAVKDYMVWAADHAAPTVKTRKMSTYLAAKGLRIEYLRDNVPWLLDHKLKPEKEEW